MQSLVKNKAMSWSRIVIILVIILSPTTDANDPCRFESTRGVIDLTSLGLNNGSAAYPKEGQVTSNYRMLFFFWC
jgi:hypothetical protein